MARKHTDMNDFYIFELPANVTLEDVARNLRKYFILNENMEVQIFRTAANSCVVKGSTPRSVISRLCGMDVMVAVRLTMADDGSIVVEVSRSMWLRRSFNALASWIVGWPFAFTTALGAYRQRNLPGRVLSNIANCIAA